MYNMTSKNYKYLCKNNKTMELLVPKLYEFFDYQDNGKLGRPLFDFIKTRQDCFFYDEFGSKNISMGMVSYISSICNKMVDDNLLIRLKTNGVECLNDVFFVHLRPDNYQYPKLFKEHLAYGYYDFAYNGFPFTRAHFMKSVVPIIGKNKKGDIDIGTAYYIGNNEFVTAAHCILDLSGFRIQYTNGTAIKISEIYLAVSSEDLDLAILKADESIGLLPLLFGQPEVLDSVLTMGYPKIPGMDAVLISETGTISTFIPPAQKASSGQVVAEAQSFLTPMDYFLINCRVKGGNSGGPVINSHGLVVGTVSQLVYDDKDGSDTGRYDIMGFGCCISSEHLLKMHEHHNTKALSFDGNYYYLK